MSQKAQTSETAQKTDSNCQVYSITLTPKLQGIAWKNKKMGHNSNKIGNFAERPTFRYVRQIAAYLKSQIWMLIIDLGKYNTI